MDNQPNQCTVFYRGGHVVNVKPMPDGDIYSNRDIIYSANIIRSDGYTYDLTDKSSIATIRMPKMQNRLNNVVSESLGVTGALDYVLRMKAGLYWNNKEYELAIACLEKATEIMACSDVGWPKKDYFRIVDWLEQLGRIEDADKWINWINDNIKVAGGIFDYDPATRYIQEAKECETDLCYIDWLGASCPICAKYQGRVYSISGKDKRFPALPDYIKQTGRIHEGCVHSIHPFVFWNDKKLDTIFYKGKNISATKASWRPFVDDREIGEKQKYDSFKAKRENEAQSAYWRSLYFRLKAFMPDDTPKSQSAFTKMRNNKPDDYQALIEKARERGFVFPVYNVKVQEPVDPEPNYRGGKRRLFFW